MKLWDKGIEINKLVETFTIGKDRETDLFIAQYDVLGTMAHITMLQSIGLLTAEELSTLLSELKVIYTNILAGNFVIEEGIEDVHSEVELLLCRKLGDIGKKVHSGRSRNDQVLVDLKLYMRAEIQKTVAQVIDLFTVLQNQSERYKDILIPGYTHLQVAMPSSFGLWFGAYAESLTDDLHVLQAAYKIVNQNPLGSAAGYGSSFPLNRTMTTRLLGFDDLNYNVVYAQMTRGKSEKITSFALASIAATLSKMAMDVCLFMSQNFKFISLPDEFTTGSSIMPHKKNPDVFELIRAKCNRIQSLPNEILLVCNNLPSGYFRDMQIIKEMFIPAFSDLSDCLNIATFITDKISVTENILEDEKYKYVFSVEEVNKETLNGVPFRDAYKKVAKEIADGSFKPDTSVHHTHEGSIGNLCNDRIKAKLDKIIQEFNFGKTEKAIEGLIKG
ncbi:MAG: argininosuccinate lyase [Bacteroidota bacterium]|nr:argininosuccinate lyase [Bacteroidota bacterium]